MNCFTVENPPAARLLAAFADTHFAATRSTWGSGVGRKVPAELFSEYTSDPDPRKREIYEIHMFNTFHFVPGICIAYHSILGSRHFV